MGQILTRRGYDWSDKEKSLCASETLSNQDARTWIYPDGSIKVLVNQVVVHLIIKDKSSDETDDDSSKKLPKRKYRRAILTRGAMTLVSLKEASKNKLKSKARAALHEIVAVELNEKLGVVEIYIASGYISKLAFSYQNSPLVTPNPMLQALMQGLVVAYRGTPPWAIPVRWNVPSTLCSVQQSDNVLRVDGKDGGFSSSLFPRFEATCIDYYPSQPLDLPEGPDEIYDRLISHQAKCPGYHQSLAIDIVAFVASFISHKIEKSEVSDKLKESKPVSPDELTHLLALDAVEKCLPFNLIIRKLEVLNITSPLERIQTALSRLLQFNVTLVELNLRGTVLKGMGKNLGRALATNIQPLLARINLEDCSLTQDDVDGLVTTGLARVWCGGSALPECIRISSTTALSNEPFGIGSPDNHSQAPQPLNWDILYNILLDSTQSFANYPTMQQPPPPSLSFLQVLDVRGTLITHNSRLQTVIAKAVNLRTFGIGGGSDATATGVDHFNDIFRVLAESATPHLQIFLGRDLIGGTYLNSALHRHQRTLKTVTLENFMGDVTGVLCQWPEPNKKACPAVEISKNNRRLQGARFSYLDTYMTSFAPGSLALGDCHSVSNLTPILQALSNCASGLLSLKIENVHYTVLASAAAALAKGGLQKLELTPTTTNGAYSQMCVQFWTNLATSKTLQTLKIPDQLSNTFNDLEMVGTFLKTNRSVGVLAFDSKELALTVDGVMALRSAFYGNNKVIDMEFPTKSKDNLMMQTKSETKACLQTVADCKFQIKRLFKAHYSKYNYNWRDRPNTLKLPWVEKIRVAKRRIGELSRNSKKIASLLQQVQTCINENRFFNEKQKDEKDRIKVNNRETQFTGIAQKKERITKKLLKKLHHNKTRARKHKSGKTQVPRSHYYSDKRMWRVSKGNKTSHWHHLNDPYYMRYPYVYYPHDGSFYDNNSENEEGQEVGEDGNVVDSRQIEELLEKENAIEENQVVWESMVGVKEDLAPQDPWSNMNELVNNDPDILLTPEVLNEIHREAAELGPDVVADIAPILDEAAAVNTQIEDISYSMGVDNGLINGAIASYATNDFSTNTIINDFDEIPDYDGGDITNDIDVDEQVNMYAGAGPRDLDDGGPSFGNGNNAATAGARRRARTRKTNRVLRRVRERTILSQGYSNLILSSNFEREDHGYSRSIKKTAPWPNDLVTQLKRDTVEMQIEAMSESALFSFPDINKHTQVLDWSSDFTESNNESVQVILVTQCSMDRFTNLQAQLTKWRGMASIAIYLSHNEDVIGAKSTILKGIKEVKQMVGDTSQWDVTVNLYKSDVEDGLYPINFLRNAALLEAKKKTRRT